MKKLFYFLLALLASQQLMAQTKTWNGSVDTDWYNGANWTLSGGATAGAPTATDNVIINIASPDPIIASGNAVAKSITLDVVGGALTINAGATLTVSSNTGDVISVSRGTLTNNGSLTVTLTNGSFVSGQETLALTNAGIVTNSGTMTLSAGLNVALSSVGGAFTNQSGGAVTANGRDLIRMGSTGTSFTNAAGATFKGSATNTAIFAQPATIANSGTVDIIGAIEMYNSSIFTNNACGKFKVTGSLFNQTGSTLSNVGFLHVTDNLSNNGTATNTGVLKYNTASGTITNSGNASLRVNNTPTPIFTYGGTFNGTVNGIFKDSLEIQSAGNFMAPNTFTGSNTLPVGLQTLYAKITPFGGACMYIVPFTYVYTPPPSFTTQPANSAVCAGVATSFTVAADDATSYQWQISTNGGGNWTNLSNNSTYTNVTTTTLIISNSTGLGSSIYRCVATGPGGSTNSNAASITLNPSTTPPSVGTVTWTGAVNNDWNTPCNWSPASVPTADNDVVINNVTNDPVVANGTTATTGYLSLNSGALLTVNTGGILNVRGNSADGMKLTAATFTNNGTTDIQRSGGLPFSSGGIYAPSSATVNNAGTLTVNASVYPISNAGTTLTVNNNTGGVLNVINGNAFSSIGAGTPSLNIVNNGVINVNCTSMSGFKALTNNGTVNINNGGISVLSGKAILNNVCGRIYVNAGGYSNEGTTTNNGLIRIVNQLYISTGFTNRGVLKYGTLSGTVTNTTTAAVIVKDSPTPIFTYGGASFSGTIDGIFTDSTTNTSAGTFTAPNTFAPSGSLPAGSQTLYAKITPSGSACFYVVPFIYVLLPNFTAQPTPVTVCVPQAASFTVAATNAASFQWQISTNGGGDWTDITASAVYTNVTTPTLNISNTTGLNANQYRCVATNVGGSVNSNAATLTAITTVSTPTGTLTWTGAISTDWNLSCNWSPASVPGAGNDVVIPNTTNDPVIGAGIAASAKTVEVQTGALFTIDATAGITINGTKLVSSIAGAFHNSGTVNNNGFITIGNLTSSGSYGIVNKTAFNNNAGGEIKVDNATSGGINSNTGTFDNSGKLTIGSVSAITGPGIFNDASFSNNAGGEIRIDQITGNGIFNRSGSFGNAAKITIGASSNISSNGILNDAVFNNNVGGEITVENASSSGLYNRGGSFTNFALFTSGMNVNGWLNRAVFNNQNCGKIRVKAGTFVNDLTGNYTNQGYTEIRGSLSNSATFTNNGTLKYGSLTGTVTNNTNPSLIVNNNPANSTIFTYGGTYNGTVNGIFTDSTANTSAGTFTAPNTFVPSGSLPVGSQTLYAKVTPSGSACSYVVPFTYVVATPAPVFSTQPTNRAVCTGTATSFTAAATNAASYQWQLSTNGGGMWANISASAVYTNVTTATLNISNVTGLNGNQYRCVATGAGGNTNSNAATLLVSPANLTLVSPADDLNANAGIKQATQTITATNQLTAPANVTYRAGSAITLNPGFTAANGVVFLSQIGGCN